MAIGVFFSILAMLFFSLMYAFYKLSSPYIPTFEIIFIQSLGSWILILPFALKKGWTSLKTTRLSLIVFRSLAGIGSVICIAKALETIHLAEVMILNNAAPLIVPLFLWVWQKFKISLSSWFSILIGFVGVMILAKPHHHLHWETGILFAFFSAIFSALLIIFAKRVAKEPYSRILFYYFLLFCILFGLLLPFYWTQPPLKVLLFLILSSIVSVAGQFSLVKALRFAPAYLVASLAYTAVLFSVFIDWIVWHSVPTSSTVLGMTLIAGGGILTIFLSRKKLKLDAAVLIDPINSAEKLKNAAQELGFKVIAIYTQPLSFFEHRYHIPQESLLAHCDEVIFSDDSKILRQKLKHLPFEIRACIAGLDTGVELADQLSHTLDLWGNSMRLSSARRDKAKMRAWLKKSGLSCPDFAICHQEKEVLEFAQLHDFPMMIKTPKGGFTSQIFVCQNERQLIEGFQDILSKETLFGKRSKYAVIEEYISGTEYIVDIFSNGEKVFVTDIWFYEKFDAGHFNNITFNAISLPIDDPSVKEINDYAIQIAKIFEINRGPAHIEIKNDPLRGPTLIEVNARLAGARIPEFLKTCSNFDLYSATIQVFANGFFPMPSSIHYSKHLALALCPVLESGIIKRIDGLEKIQKLSSYYRHILNVREGEKIQATTHGGTTPLWVYLAHKERNQLLQDLQSAHELFKIEFEK